MSGSSNCAGLLTVRSLKFYSPLGASPDTHNCLWSPHPPQSSPWPLLSLLTQILLKSLQGGPVLDPLLPTTSAMRDNKTRTEATLPAKATKRIMSAARNWSRCLGLPLYTNLSSATSGLCWTCGERLAWPVQFVCGRSCLPLCPPPSFPQPLWDLRQTVSDPFCVCLLLFLAKQSLHRRLAGPHSSGGPSKLLREDREHCEH